MSAPPRPPQAGRKVSPPRVLFLDDDPFRAAVFLKDRPEAVWVQTAAECIARLSEPWDEVHLDHDLGGEHFVDPQRDDCGMAVVRWVCARAGASLKPARFYVHSHNAGAAAVMAMQLALNGYNVELRPFGTPSPADPPADPVAPHDGPPAVPPPPPDPSAVASLVRWVRRLLRRPDPADAGRGSA